MSLRPLRRNRLGRSFAEIQRRDSLAVGQHVLGAWEQEIAKRGDDAERCADLLAAYRDDERARERSKP